MIHHAQRRDRRGGWAGTATAGTPRRRNPGFLVGAAVGTPSDIDVGAGHAVFHLFVALSVGLAALWLIRNGATRVLFPVRSVVSN